MPISTQKPYAQSCENNKQPILAAIKPLLISAKTLLEVGSGTGQHAVHFAAHLPHLCWQTGDQLAYHAGIQQWLDEAALDNIRPPLELDVRDADWSQFSYDAVFTANTLHIMSADSAEMFVTGVSAALNPGGLFIAYGPFNYRGAYSSDSNANFDRWLKQQHPLSAIRDFEWLDQCARKGGMRLLKDLAMPSNNRLLAWRKEVK